MKHRRIAMAGAAILMSTRVVAQTAVQNEPGKYARIAILRPHDGDTVDFEAGYTRHLDWHRQARDAWVWYGWTITFGERQRWFVYASFGHSAADFDNPVSPADDERDNVVNVLPHAQFLGNAVYEYLPELSRGTGVPQPIARLELTTIDLNVGSSKEFEAALATQRSTLRGETLWFRMIAGGAAPRYVRLRAAAGVAAILEAVNEQVLPEGANRLIAKTTIEILTLRPTMSHGLAR